MKKLLVLVLIVPILALAMISCDADMRSNLASLMGGLGGNLYEGAGLIVVNTAQAEAAAATVAAIGTGAGAEAVTAGENSSSLGIAVTIPDGVTSMLAPQAPAKQKELKDNLGDALNSETQKKKLLEDMKNPVAAGSDQQKAAQGTVKVLNASLDKIKEGLDDGNPGSSDLGKTLEKLKLPEIDDLDDLTEGDLLALQLMTDLISNTVNTLTEIGGTLGGADDDAIGDSANRDKVLSIVDDALFAADMAEQLSGSASIDFTGQIDLGALLDGLGDKGTRSRGEPVELTDAEDFIGTINDLAPSIVELMGITYDGEDFIYTNAKYKSFLLNQWIYRSSMEQAMKMMSLGNLAKKDIVSLTFDTSTLVKYALAVFITEHDDFMKDKYPAIAPNSVIAAYLNATDSTDPTKTNKKLGLGTLTKNDSLRQPDVLGFSYDTWPTFVKASGKRGGSTDSGKAYYKAILENIVKINDLGGIAQLSTELNKFLTDSTDDGFDKTYDDLMQ